MKTYLDIAEERSIQAIKESKVFADYREEGDAFLIEFEYPRSVGKVKHIEVGLSDVRASDGIRITYDFDRDGYAIEQPYFTFEEKEGYSQQITHWKETTFLQSWALEELSDKDFLTEDHPHI